MLIEEASRRLHDYSFLLGRFRRRSAIRELSASTDPVSATVLADALCVGHPDSQRIDAALRQLVAKRNADKVQALWEHWAHAPNVPVADILAELGWPPDREPSSGSINDILAAAIPGTFPEILKAVAIFARNLPLANEPVNDAICAAWLRSQSSELGCIIAEQSRYGVGTASAIALASALSNSHPDAARIDTFLRQFSAERDPGKVLSLWEHWAEAPCMPLAAILSDLGWPAEHVARPRIVRNILQVANSSATPQILETVTVFARSLPVADEEINDVIYGAWVRSQSPDLERLISWQGRQPGTPALEALHALVTGRIERYAALHDESGHLLIQAYALAPEPLRVRMARAVAASPERRIKTAYREALKGAGVGTVHSIDNLKRVADEDGLFESCRTLRLMQVLELCERWADSSVRPCGASQRAAVDLAVTAYRRLCSIGIDNVPALPDGLVDIFDWWRIHSPDDDQLHADLEDDDPFIKARGIFLGQQRGILPASSIAAAAGSKHWPERLMARLVDPACCAHPGIDHVLWASACGCDVVLLNAVMEGTPEEYASHKKRLAEIPDNRANARNRDLLEILCAFQAVFVGAGITVDHSSEAANRYAVEIEDAPDEIF